MFSDTRWNMWYTCHGYMQMVKMKGMDWNMVKEIQVVTMSFEANERWMP